MVFRMVVYLNSDVFFFFITSVHSLETMSVKSLETMLNFAPVPLVLLEYKIRENTIDMQLIRENTCNLNTKSVKIFVT
jgi:hypothetical protein